MVVSDSRVDVAPFDIVVFVRPDAVVRVDFEVRKVDEGLTAKPVAEDGIVEVFKVVLDVVCFGGVDDRVGEVDREVGISNAEALGLDEVLDLSLSSAGPGGVRFVLALGDCRLKEFEDVGAVFAPYFYQLVKIRAHPFLGLELVEVLDHFW